MHLPKAASAPGKVILFGEHAVVYGRPAIAVAISLRAKAILLPSRSIQVCGREDGGSAYLWTALRRLWRGPPVNLLVASDIPSASGMGSSAAVTVSSVASILLSRGEFSAERVARESFEVEYEVQGRASPTDTSTSTAGGAVMLEMGRKDGLWTVEKGQKIWTVRRLEVEPFPLVVVLSGKRSDTKRMVSRVAERLERDPSLWEVVDGIGRLVGEAAGYLKSGDLPALGDLMYENQGLLARLGVSHPLLERIIRILRPHVYGAKLTGAGGGGSVVAIPKDPKAAANAALSEGFRVVQARIELKGVSEERV